MRRKETRTRLFLLTMHAAMFVGGMDITIQILAAIGALMHVVFFIFESILWTTPAVRKIFQQTEADAKTTRLMALNQGYYNLFLAIATVAGIWLLFHTATNQAVGSAVLTVSLGSMVGASLVLLFSAGKKMIRGVLLQGLAPAVALALLWRPL
jgi:putative membrane protein